MACFIIPLTQAIATTVYRKHVATTEKNTFVTRNLKTLEQMLWGGSLMLVLDHIINGEVTYIYPFFTALTTEGGGMVMLREMLTVGVPMSILVTAVWAIGCLIKEKKAIHALK